MLKLDPIILKLIREVKKRRCLWDVFIPQNDCGQRRSTEVAWNEIALELGQSGTLKCYTKYYVC